MFSASTENGPVTPRIVNGCIENLFLVSKFLTHLDLPILTMKISFHTIPYWIPPQSSPNSCPSSDTNHSQKWFRAVDWWKTHIRHLQTPTGWTSSNHWDTAFEYSSHPASTVWTVAIFLPWWTEAWTFCGRDVLFWGWWRNRMLVDEVGGRFLRCLFPGVRRGLLFLLYPEQVLCRCYPSRRLLCLRNCWIWCSSQPPRIRRRRVTIVGCVNVIPQPCLLNHFLYSSVFLLNPIDHKSYKYKYKINMKGNDIIPFLKWTFSLQNYKKLCLSTPNSKNQDFLCCCLYWGASDEVTTLHRPYIHVLTNFVLVCVCQDVIVSICPTITTKKGKRFKRLYIINWVFTLKKDRGNSENDLIHL